MSIKLDSTPETDPRTQFLVRYAGDFVPETVAHASGAWLTTVDGRRVLDFTSGQICATIGHGHPAIGDAVRGSLQRVAHLSSYMLGTDVLELADRLAATLPSPLSKSLFLSTGGEANEAALRMAKLITGGFEVVALTRSWHGVNAGANAVTYAGARAGYGPALPGAHAIPAPYSYRCPIRHCDGTCDHTCLRAGFELFDQRSVGAPAAVIAEPVLSTGGVVVPPPGYFVELLELCREREMLLLFDEAQTGLGRLGAMYGFELYGIVPDFLLLSKTLGGGLPISALITTPELEAAAHAGGFYHVTSHVSDPLPAAAAVAVVDVIEGQDLARQAGERGEYLGKRLCELQRRHESIGDVRGVGLLQGVELVKDRESKEPDPALGRALTSECQRCGLAMNVVRGRHDLGGSCLRLAPPLTIEEREIDTAIEILDASLTRVLANGRGGE
jgi:2,2-dialkylglycine decarboxylase (pyruvate)